MTKWILAAGAAAIALAAPAFGEKGGQGGQGQSAERRGAEHQADERQGGDNRGAGKSEARKAERYGQADRVEARRGETGHGKAGRELRSELSEEKSARRVRSSTKNRGRRDSTDSFDDDFNAADSGGNRRDRGRFADDWRNRGLVEGCPPGLAAKDNGCLPPGLAKKLDIGDRLNRDGYSSAFMPDEYRDFYRDSDDYYYRSDQGYIYRVDRDNDLVAGLIPLLGGGFGVGQTMPAGYDFYNVPAQYRSLYSEQDDYYYRYGDNAIYRVERSSNLIDSVAALLAGDLAVGSQLPLGYDVYNVPMQYRDRYADSADSLYRYNDGNIYQVDPTTRLIQAVISAIV